MGNNNQLLACKTCRSVATPCECTLGEIRRAGYTAAMARARALNVMDAFTANEELLSKLTDAEKEVQNLTVTMDALYDALTYGFPRAHDAPERKSDAARPTRLAVERRTQGLLQAFDLIATDALHMLLGPGPREHAKLASTLLSYKHELRLPLATVKTLEARLQTAVEDLRYQLETAKKVSFRERMDFDLDADPLNETAAWNSPVGSYDAGE